MEDTNYIKYLEKTVRNFSKDEKEKKMKAIVEITLANINKSS